MKAVFFIQLFILSYFTSNAQLNRIDALPSLTNEIIAQQPNDWLVKPTSQKAGIYKSVDGKDLILYNGLVKRAFRIKPNVACIDYQNMSNGQQLLRDVKPEAVITIDGVKHNIGGLHGQQEKAYLLREWVDDFVSSDSDFQFQTYEVSDINPLINWKPKSFAMVKSFGTGKKISFSYTSLNQQLKNIVVKVNYELYDGIPLIVKSVAIDNNSNKGLVINRVVNEILGFVEEESAVVGTPEQMKKQHGIYLETNYAFNNAMRYDISDQTTHWKTDSTYTSQVNYYYQTPCVLEVYPENVTAIGLAPGEKYKSVRTHELLMDSYDRERRGLAIRQMYKTVAPWTSENPIFMHLVSSDDEQVKTAVDQCAATGYEALILSFGSHCDMEDTSVANVKRWKELSDYAHSKNILIGSYSLFSSRRISDEHDVIDPVTGLPDKGALFGNAPCLGSQWGLDYIQKLKFFMTKTGFDIFENDGPYPGDLCASVKHPGHKGLGDSQWKQMELQKELYRWCNQSGIYINAPDWYFLDGSNKIGIGYREVNFSLSREQQKILNRQNIFDGLWEKSPSMAWGFVPLTKYQGGGPEAVLEPLSDHLKDYEQLMAIYYGSGVQACYRGPRLYDTEQTKQTVINSINWYKKYRSILNSDIIHLRRADGRDWDGIMHVNPSLKTKAFLMLYNPLKEKIKRTIKLPLYYSGLTQDAIVKLRDQSPLKLKLNRNYEIDLTVEIEAEGYTWLVIE